MEGKPSHSGNSLILNKNINFMSLMLPTNYYMNWVQTGETDDVCQQPHVNGPLAKYLTRV